MWCLKIRGRLRLLLPNGDLCPGLTQPELLLLAVLAASPRDLTPRAELAAMIWEPERCQDPRACLRVALARLRSRLPQNALREESDRIGIESGWLEVDATGAAELYKGCAQQWARAERERDAEASHPPRLLAEAESLVQNSPAAALEFLVENERAWEYLPWHQVLPVLKSTLGSTAGQSSALRKMLFACERHIGTVQGADEGGERQLARLCHQANSEGDWVLAGRALQSLMVRASARWNFRDSMYWCTEGERLATRLVDPYVKAGLLGNCAIVRLDAMDFRAGLKLLEQSADAYAQAGHANGHAAFTTIRSRALALTGEVRQARVVWEWAGAHYAHDPNDRFAPWYRLTEALICRSEGDDLGAQAIAERLLISDGFRPGISFVAVCAETIASGRARQGDLGQAANWLWYSRACQRVNNGAPSPLERQAWQKVRTQIGSRVSASDSRTLRRRSARLVEQRSILVESGV